MTRRTGRPITYRSTPEQFVDILNDHPNGLPKPRIIALLGEDLTTAQFTHLKERARVYAVTLGLAITVPRPGDAWRYRLTYNDEMIGNSFIYHGRSAATHMDTAGTKFLDVIIARFGPATEEGMRARLLKPQAGRISSEIRMLAEMVSV